MIKCIPKRDIESSIDLAVGDGKLLKVVSNKYNNDYYIKNIVIRKYKFIDKNICCRTNNIIIKIKLKLKWVIYYGLKVYKYKKS